MNEQAVKPAINRLVDREFHNIRELLEMLMTEMSPTNEKLKMRPNLGWAPPTDVYETETEFIVTMDIAGMDISNINVLTDGTVLKIHGVRNEVAPKCKKQFHKMEIQVGPFQRLIQLPSIVEDQNLFTNYANGLLEIRLKKKFNKPRKRSIEVE